MKRTRHSSEQTISKLREADAMTASGKNIAQVVQALGVSEQTFHRWRNQYGGMKSSDARRLKELERERAAQADRGGSGVGHRDAQGGGQGGILSPTRRRLAVSRLQAMFAVSERRACRAMNQCRSSQRYEPIENDQVKSIVKRMHELVRGHPRFRYRRITDDTQA
jgi:putative transposase